MDHKGHEGVVFNFYLSGFSVANNSVLRFGTQFLIHSIDAPSSTHRPRIILSSWVIPVLFPRGIAIVVTVWVLMIEAKALICLSLSNTMPLGAILKTSSVGFEEWQLEQRWSTIVRTSVNGICSVPSVALFGELEIRSTGFVKKMSTKIAETAAGKIQMFKCPLFFKLKKCLTVEPIKMITIKINQSGTRERILQILRIPKLAGAVALPSTHAGAQDDGTLTNSLTLLY